MLEAGIVDPAKVVRAALQDAASVAGLLIAAFVAAGLVIWAGWSPGEAETKKIIQKDEAAAHPQKPLGPQPPLKQDGVPAPLHQPEPRAPGSPPNGGVPGKEGLNTLGSPRSRDPRGRP